MRKKGTFSFWKRVSVAVFCLLLLWGSVFAFPLPAGAAEDTAGIVPAVAAGKSHTLALKEDGTVWAWGDNTFGQLGDGTEVSRTRPVKVEGLNLVVAIAAGNYHSLAVDSKGQVWSWGRNLYGQLGDGTTEYRNVPVKVRSLENITLVAAGEHHSLAVDGEGKVWGWGRNLYGQLGLKEKTDFDTWGEELDLRWVKEVFYNEEVHPELMPRESVVVRAGAIAAGGDTSLAISESGTLWGWGANWEEQIGKPTLRERQALRNMDITRSVELQNVPGFVGINTVIGLASGKGHTVALKEDGTVWALGGNSHGQLGDGTNRGRSTPEKVKGLQDIQAVSAGAEFSVAIDDSGYLWAWGSNVFGQLGLETGGERHLPVRVRGLEGVIAVSAGFEHVVALTEKGEVWAWGNNSRGALGSGDNESSSKPVLSLSRLFDPVPPELPVDITVLINEVRIPLDLRPVLDNNRVMLPLKSIGNVFGAVIIWEGETRTVTVHYDQSSTSLQIGQEVAMVDGAYFTLEIPPRLIEGSTFVPLQFIEEAFQARASWDEDSRRVYLYTE